jgi:hypothetical protein
MSAVAKIAATCERTNAEIISPSPVAASVNRSPPIPRASAEPLSGTPSTPMVTRTRVAKDTIPTAT